jgi:hypothetical protein
MEPVSRAQMVCAVSLVNPMAVLVARIAAAGKITQATSVPLWVAPALDHAVFLQHTMSNFAIEKKPYKVRNCEDKEFV